MMPQTALQTVMALAWVGEVQTEWPCKMAMGSKAIRRHISMVEPRAHGAGLRRHMARHLATGKTDGVSKLCGRVDKDEP